VWDRNFQLAFWSASIYLPILIYDNPTNPFVGWSSVAIACSAVGALGGTPSPSPPPPNKGPYTLSIYTPPI
jgi:hypothetical protein